MENNYDIDKKFNEASKALEEPPTFQGFEKVWNKIEEKLDKKEDKKRIVPIWFPYGIAASLIIGLGVFYFVDKKNTIQDNVKPIITENRIISQPPNKTIAKIDSTVKVNIQNEIKNVEKQQTIAYETNINEAYKPIITKANKPITSTYELKQVPIDRGNIPFIHDTLNREKKIEEIVVLGYGRTVTKSSITSSSVKVSGSKYKNKSNGFINSLQEQGQAESIMSYRNSEPVILGYNKTQVKAKTVVSSNTPMLAERIENRPNVSILNDIQGHAPGIVINSGSGSPGASKTDVVIRGVSSVNSNAEPLYIINGVISNSTQFRNLASHNIKSILVLKNAEATSIYGNRGANGVIVVEAKKLSRAEKRKLKRLQKTQDSLSQLRHKNMSFNNEEYDAFVENPFELTKREPLSTFSIDVDNASYSNIRRMINNGEKVNKNAVRVEEMINYFKYDYPQPKNSQPFSINTEYNEAPWNTNHKLLKIGLQGKNISVNNLPGSNLIFLIDVSGSMDEANKLPLLKSSFKILLEQLREQDKVGIVVYAGSAGMVLPPTSAREKDKIISALDKLQAGGSTAGGEGIELAYKLAQDHFIKGGNNRVIIATDGDFNVGISSASDLGALIEEKRKSGIFLTCLGFGMGNYKDNRLETLADKGNGNYAYIDNIQEANKFLGKEFAGSMYTIAKDVKIQIEFNPKYVKSYRLIGYENRKLRNEDFTNDKIDAGELGSGHTVTALYEIIPTDVDSEFLPKETGLKYSSVVDSWDIEDDLATIKFRYKKVNEDISREINHIVKNSDDLLSAASPDFKFASSVAWFGLVLRNSELIKRRNLNDIENLVKRGIGKDEERYRSEFKKLIESYKKIQK